MRVIFQSVCKAEIEATQNYLEKLVTAKKKYYLFKNYKTQAETGTD